MKIDYCYHTHTKRCGHAVGEDRDYVLAAINIGLKRMGFSDHVMIKDIIQPKVRAGFEHLDEYIDSVHSLQKEFKGKIDIKLAFECEYAKHLEPYYRYLKEERGFDYLLLGQHCTFTPDNQTVLYFHPKEQPGKVQDNVTDLINGMKSGLFLYVCHPDLYVSWKTSFDEECVLAAHQICQAAVRYHIPLELNVNGRYWRDCGRLKYSCEDFWKIAATYPINVVLGYDAHNPEHFNRSLDFFEELINKYSLHMIDLKV